MKLTSVALASMLSLVSVGFNTLTFAQSTNDRAATRAVTVTPLAGVVGDKTRLAVFVTQGGVISRSVNVFGVTRPSTGLYCIRHNSAPAINVNTAIPIAHVEWSTSLGNGSLVQWRSSGIGCPSGHFAVLTFQLSSGAFVESNAVSFTFVVP